VRRRLRPELKVLLTSGYTASALALEHGLPETLTVLRKPYRGDDLANKLRLAIGRWGVASCVVGRIILLCRKFSGRIYEIDEYVWAYPANE
jgi:hypothetical protein